MNPPSDHPLVIAAFQGDTREVASVLKSSPRLARDILDLALQSAAGQGHVEAMEVLIPRVKQQFKDSQALGTAAMFGQLAAVKLLIPISSPKKQHSWPLRIALGEKQLHVVRELIPVSDPDEAGALMIKNEQYDLLDRLALVLCDMGGHEDLVSRWWQTCADELPLTASRRVAEQRASHAGTAKHLVRSRHARTRC